MIAALGYRRPLFRPFRTDAIPCIQDAETALSQGGAPRLRRCALPWAFLFGPLRGEAVVEPSRQSRSASDMTSNSS